jgi:type IX secretion system PorP/SprF family membrane protein
MRIIIATILIIFFTGISKGQDPLPSQFFMDKLYINPGFAGTTKENKYFLNYRIQTVGTDVLYSTLNASYDSYFSKIRGGIGIHVQSDREGNGLISRQRIDNMYAYRLQVNPLLYFTGGIAASLVQRKQSYENMVLPSMMDEYTGEISSSGMAAGGKAIYFMDFSTGVTGFYENKYVGLSVHHLNRPDESFSKQGAARVKRKYTFYAGGDFELKRRGLIREIFILSPHFLYQYQYSHLLCYGMMAQLQGFATGAFFRQNLPFELDTGSLLLGFIQPGYELFYSYDFKFRKILYNLPTINSHEVTFLINL